MPGTPTLSGGSALPYCAERFGSAQGRVCVRVRGGGGEGGGGVNGQDKEQV